MSQGVFFERRNSGENTTNVFIFFMCGVNVNNINFEKVVNSFEEGKTVLNLEIQKPKKKQKTNVLTVVHMILEASVKSNKFVFMTAASSIASDIAMFLEISPSSAKKTAQRAEITLLENKVIKPFIINDVPKKGKPARVMTFTWSFLRQVVETKEEFEDLKNTQILQMERFLKNNLNIKNKSVEWYLNYWKKSQTVGTEFEPFSYQEIEMHEKEGVEEVVDNIANLR